MPPKFDKFQAVHLEIVDFTPEKHHKWSERVWWHEGRFDSSFSAYIVFGVAIKGKIFFNRLAKSTGNAGGVGGGPEGGGGGEGDAGRRPDREGDEHGHLRERK